MDGELVNCIALYNKSAARGNFNLRCIQLCYKYIINDPVRTITLITTYERRDLLDRNNMTLAQCLLCKYKFNYEIVSMLCTHLFEAGFRVRYLAMKKNELMIAQWILNNCAINDQCNLQWAIFNEISHGVARWNHYLSIFCAKTISKCACIAHLHDVFCEYKFIINIINYDYHGVCFKNHKCGQHASWLGEKLIPYYDEIRAGRDEFRKIACKLLPEELIVYIIDFTLFDCGAIY